MLADTERASGKGLPDPKDLRAYIDYLRDLSVYDLLTQPVEPSEAVSEWARTHLRDALSPNVTTTQERIARDTASQRISSVAITPAVTPFERAQQRVHGVQPQKQSAGPTIRITPPPDPGPSTPQDTEWLAAPGMVTPAMPAPVSFNQLAPIPVERVTSTQKPAALQAVRDFIGDCTRCPLAYAGRHRIVFADGDPQARLMFVGEGPGADEDAQGLPFVGKAGQLLNSMIGAMGLKREQVYIANIVKCRPPGNRTPEPVEANTCTQFLVQQIDIVQPEVIVALGATAATHLLGVKQSLASLRGRWFDVRGAQCAVTYHPAFLLRDPRQKGEAWKDLQRVMAHLKLATPPRS